jgi:hypothetical protein
MGGALIFSEFSYSVCGVSQDTVKYTAPVIFSNGITIVGEFDHFFRKLQCLPDTHIARPHAPPPGPSSGSFHKTGACSMPENRAFQ